MLPGIIVVPGDAVTVRYSETTEAIVPVVDISVMGINLRSSDEQQATDARVAKVDEAQAEVQEPRQAEQEFKQLSPDQQRQVLEQMRQGADN